jgi:DNA polymerase-3 subunit alpha
MAAAGAFDSLDPNRAKVYGGAEILLRHAQAQDAERKAGQTSLFGGSAGAQMAALELPDVQAWDPMEKLRNEFDAVGFYLSAHPLDAKAGQLERLGVVQAANALDYLAGRPVVVMDMAGVLLRKQIKVSPKTGNKYAFLQLSDSSGVFEVTLFSETLAAAREILVEGEPLLLKVTAEQREEQIRYTVQNLRPLDQALAGKVKEVHIHLDNEKPVSQLKTLLDVEGKGAVKIIVFARTDARTVAEMTLPGRWNFSAATRNALGRAPGVKEVREF